MALVWHALPSWKVHKHQPVPDFAIRSGNWEWWDRRDQSDQSLFAGTSVRQGSQPFVCTGGGEIQTTENNIGAMLLMLVPRSRLASVVFSTITLHFGQRFAARITYDPNGYDWLGVTDFVRRAWKLELLVDGSVQQTAVMHHTVNQRCVTFAAGIDRSNPSDQRFYCWLSNAGNPNLTFETDISRADVNCNFGSGNCFLQAGFDDANQVNHPTRIAVTGNASFSPVYYLQDGFQQRGSLSPVSLEDRIASAGDTPYSMRHPALNFLQPFWRGNSGGLVVLGIDNGGQAETVGVPSSGQGNFFPDNFTALFGYNRYTDTPIYAHCIANYKHSLKALIPDADGPPLHHESAVRTRLKQIRITPNFNVRETVFPFTFPLQSTDYSSHSPIDVGLDSGCLGDWSGSAVLGNGSTIYYLISLRRSEIFASGAITSFDQASLLEATTLHLRFHIPEKPGFVISRIVDANSPTATVRAMETTGSLGNGAQLDSTLQAALFSGAQLHIGTSLTARSTFTIEAVGT